MLSHEYYMRLVLDLAAATAIQTRPNPQVAAILVRNQQIVGIGTHLFAGGPHAEVHAISQAGSNANAATLYVNLEPCAHFGKTPPCADAVIAAKIAKVVIATLDPNPLVRGAGVARLQAAGIDVEVGVLAAAAAEINQVFFHNICAQQPYVTLKVGMSLDGKIATKTGLSQWLTGIESRRDAHSYRVSHDAILTGVNSVISDNPSLTAHLIPDAPRHPLRVILDRQLRTPLTAKIIQEQSAATWIYTQNPNLSKQQAYRDLGVNVIYMAELAADAVLDHLYQEGICSLLIEGGEQIYASFIEAKRVNQLVTYLSPQLVGSRDAKHFFAGNGFSNLSDNLQLSFSSSKQLGRDLKVVYHQEPTNPSFVSRVAGQLEHNENIFSQEEQANVYRDN